MRIAIIFGAWLIANAIHPGLLGSGMSFWRQLAIGVALGFMCIADGEDYTTARALAKTKR